MKTKPAESQRVPTIALWLGYLGLLPQVTAITLVMLGGPYQWIALAASYAYAALIFSFLGGVWWGVALSFPATPRWAFVASVVPSLLGLALFLPWIFGVDWPGPSLLWLGFAILVSPLIDRRIGNGSMHWLALRTRLSVGLGGLTIVLAVLAMQ